ncbi:MAG TPA: glutathione S-transferase family protein [Burkholderiaceae bacterium]|nr:glutathione S-transferase family protein [Burkholderiaceae bacterium]
MTRHFTLFYAPQSRATGALVLVHELKADYELHVLNLKAGEQRAPDYLAVNPMGKVPAVLHDGALVTEQVAVYLYLADLYPEAGLAPAIGDPLRGPYLRWMAFYGSSFEPALCDRAMKHPPAPPSMCPWGDWDTMLKTITDQLEKGPYLLGDKFSAADVLWGTALNWTTAFGLVPKVPAIAAYIERVQARPACIAANAKDAELVAAQNLSA